MDDKELQALDAALAECEGHTDGPWFDEAGAIRTVADRVICIMQTRYRTDILALDTALIKHAPLLAAAVRELRETVKAREEENLKLREFLWLRHGHSIGELYGDDGEMQCSKCRLDFKRDSIDRITAAFMPDYHRNPSIDEALNGGKGDYKP